MKNLDGKRLNKVELCNLAENYAEIIKTSGIENINNQVEYDYLLELKDQLRDKTDSETNEDVITLEMKLTGTIKNIYRIIVAKEIEFNTPQWISLSKRIFERNETLQYN